MWEGVIMAPLSKRVFHTSVDQVPSEKYCLIKFIDSVMKMNLDDEISMIQILQSIYNVFKV